MERKRFMFKLKYKIAILILSASLLCVAAIGIFTYITAKRHIDDMMKVEFIDHLKLTIEDIKAFLDDVESEPRFLAKLPPVEGIIRARNNNGYDPIGKNSYGEWARHLGNTFKEMAIAYGYYMQIRLIAADAFECHYRFFRGFEGPVFWQA